MEDVKEKTILETKEAETDQKSIDFEELMRKYDTEARFRTPGGWQLKLITILAIAMSCFHFYTAGQGLLPAQKQGAVHLAFTLVLVFLLYPIKGDMPKNTKVPFYDICLAILAAVTVRFASSRIS